MSDYRTVYIGGYFNSESLVRAGWSKRSVQLHCWFDCRMLSALCDAVLSYIRLLCEFESLIPHGALYSDLFVDAAATTRCQVSLDSRNMAGGWVLSAVGVSHFQTTADSVNEIWTILGL